MGLDPEQARAAEPDADSDPAADECDDAAEDYELDPVLWDAWTCFVGTLRQWRVVSGLGGFFYDGIDSAALEATMRMLGSTPKRRQAVFWQVQILEDEARKLRNKTTST